MRTGGKSHRCSNERPGGVNPTNPYALLHHRENTHNLLPECTNVVWFDLASTCWIGFTSPCA
jgi:membrane-bound metal-dependent hydrolase YbcI (DUF457 family)